MKIEIEAIGYVKAVRQHAAVRQPAWSHELMRDCWLTK